MTTTEPTTPMTTATENELWTSIEGLEDAYSRVERAVAALDEGEFQRLADAVRAVGRHRLSHGGHEPGSLALEVFNRGPADATEVKIECAEEGFILDPSELPSVLPAGQPARVNVEGLRGEATPLVTITWLDGNGTQHRHDVPKVFLTEPQ